MDNTGRFYVECPICDYGLIRVDGIQAYVCPKHNQVLLPRPLGYVYPEAFIKQLEQELSHIKS